MDILRTPDERFTNLPDYDFAPHYVEVDGLRIHYIEQGPRDAEPVLLLHGEPSWSYLYRKMIPLLATAGHRVIAPDLVGFGRSDKPAEREAYTYQRHVDWMRGVIEALDLRRMTLMCQNCGWLLSKRSASRVSSLPIPFFPRETCLPARHFSAGSRLPSKYPCLRLAGLSRTAA